MNTTKISFLLIFSLFVGCNKSQKEINDPCRHRFNPNFSETITQQFPKIISSKIYSYPFFVLKGKEASPDFSVYTKKEGETQCEEVVLEINYNTETSLHNEKSISEVIKLFFNDEKNNVEKLNLKIISELPTQNEFYTKSKIEHVEFENSSQLDFELKQEISIADSSIYKQLGSVFTPKQNGKNRLELEISLESNLYDLDKKVFSIVEDYYEKIRSKKIEELMIDIRFLESNYYEIIEDDVIITKPIYQYNFVNLKYFLHLPNKEF